MIIANPTLNQDYDNSSLSSFESTSTVSCPENYLSEIKNNNEVFASDSPKGVYSNVCINQSSDIHIGDKNIYQGPVTIKQFLYPNGDKELKEKTENNGCDNNGYVNEDCINANGIKTDEQAVDENKSKEQISMNKKGFICLSKVAKRKTFLVFASLVTIVVTVCVLLVIFFLKNSLENERNPSDTVDTDEQDVTAPLKYDLDLTANTQQKSKLRIFNRLDWLAQPPSGNATLLRTPVPYVIIHHTATESCHSHAQCILQVRTVQMFHIESKGWWDIGYNFLIGGDGAAYEGRGWTSEGAHTFGYNSKSIGIVFIGTFMNEKPPEIQTIACKKLIERGVQLGYVSREYKLLAARQLHTTESPGKALYEDMQTWKHWSPQP